MAEIHWVSPVSGDFETGANWSGGVVPGSSDDAFLDASGTSPYTVTLTDSEFQFLNTLQMASTATLDIVNGDLSALHGVINVGTIIVGEGSGLFLTAGALANSGSIYAEDGGGIFANGTNSNSGTITLRGKGTGISVSNTTLTGGGAVKLSHAGIFGGLDHQIDHLTNVDNTIEGSGEFTDFLDFTNGVAGVVDARRGLLKFTVRNLKVTNAGLIEATDGGNCLIKSEVKNTGTLLADGGTLTLEAVVTGTGAVDLAAGAIVIENAGAAETVAFTGASGLLELTQSQTFAGAVSGFSRTGETTLDLRDIGFVSSNEATFSRGVLTVTDGNHTASFALIGRYGSVTFIAAPDNNGGTLVTALAGPAPSPHLASVAAFASAAASLAGDAAAAIHQSAEGHGQARLLARPPA